MNLRMSHKPDKGRTPHIYADNLIYFITSRTVNREHFLKTAQQKKLFIEIFNHLIDEYEIKVYHWILWSNHYHIIIEIPNGEYLHRFINRLHSSTSRLLNKLDNLKGRKIWNQYWDHCIRNELDFWRHFNYITNNPVKHGWCDGLEMTLQYPYCGTRQWVNNRGKDFLLNLIHDYPVKNFVPEQEDYRNNKLTT